MSQKRPKKKWKRNQLKTKKLKLKKIEPKKTEKEIEEKPTHLVVLLHVIVVEGGKVTNGKSNLQLREKINV